MAKSSSAQFYAQLSAGGDDSPGARARAAQARREANALMDAAELDSTVVWRHASHLHRTLTAARNHEVPFSAKDHPFGRRI
jgi:uncharacterized membrane protein